MSCYTTGKTEIHQTNFDRLMQLFRLSSASDNSVSLLLLS